jgi:hypothetical protein
VHDFSGEVQKFPGEVQNNLRGDAHLLTPSLKIWPCLPHLQIVYIYKLWTMLCIYCLPDELQISSSILKEEIAFIKQLQKWLGEKCKWHLCYRASRDGWSAKDFHRHCDNKGPTVVLVKANNYIFGGYTDQNFGEVYMVSRKNAPYYLFCCDSILIRL